MYNKQTQNLIDTLLRLKVDDNDGNNKIVFIMAKPHEERTKEEKGELSLYVINKIAFATAPAQYTKPKMGEVAE